MLIRLLQDIDTLGLVFRAGSLLNVLGRPGETEAPGRTLIERGLADALPADADASGVPQIADFGSFSVLSHAAAWTAMDPFWP
jgi:hypothetical protein